MTKPIQAYGTEVSCQAPRDRVFDAVATVRGLRGWWTPIVTGSASAGGVFQLGFGGLDETIVLRVDEATRPARVRWTCLEHTGASAWVGSTVAVELHDADAESCVLVLRHSELAPELVEPGWRHFLASLKGFVETGGGQPFGTGALGVARAYHAAWTRKDFSSAARCLSDDLRTDVPVNTYATRAEFVRALTEFGQLVRRVDVLAEFEQDDQALLLYDMHTEPFGTIRIAEQFTIADGQICHIRHVHDTAPFGPGQ